MRTEDLLNEYIACHIDSEGEYLGRLYRATHIQMLNPHMASGHIQGRALKMLVEMIRPKRILEIGTYTGYSALCMAEGLSPEGMIYTYEIEEELEDFTREWIEGSPYGRQIDFRIGDALIEAPKLQKSFDMVFIDADKRHYCSYYHMAKELLSQGGWILADNTLWDGHVIDSSYRDGQTEGIRAFNDLVAKDEEVEKSILPLRDGLTLIRKKD